MLALRVWSTLSDHHEPPVSAVQRKWTEHVDKALKLQLLSALDTPGVIKRFEAHCNGVWLNAIPMKCVGLKLSNTQVRIALSLRLGLNICQPHSCICGATVSPLGTHGLSCRKSAARFSRHTAINDLVKRTMSSAGVPCVLEPTGLTRGDGKRPDGLTTVPWSRGQSLLWDVTVVDALSPGRSGALVISATEEAEARKC